MQRNKLIRKIFFGMFILPFLISCAPKPSQLFIFESYDITNNQNAYYTADLYNPSKVEKLNFPKCDNPTNPEPTFSPNGRYYVCPNSILIKDTNNRIIGNIPKDISVNPDGFGSWSPYSQYFTFGYTSNTYSKSYHGFGTMKYDGTEYKIIIQDTNPDFWGIGNWSPNEKYLEYETIISNNDYLSVVDLNGKEISRFNLLNLTNGDPIAPQIHNWSPDSKRLTLFTGGILVGFNSSNSYYILNIEDGTISNPIPKGILCGIDSPEWSPNGQKLTLNAANYNNTNTECHFSDRRIFIFNSDGSNLKPITNPPTDGAHWSPDGKFIIFEEYQHQDSQIFIMNADGTNQRNLLGNQFNNSFFVQWITP